MEEKKARLRKSKQPTVNIHIDPSIHRRDKKHFFTPAFPRSALLLPDANSWNENYDHWMDGSVQSSSFSVSFEAMICKWMNANERDAVHNNLLKVRWAYLSNSVVSAVKRLCCCCCCCPSASNFASLTSRTPTKVAPSGWALTNNIASTRTSPS